MLVSTVRDLVLSVFPPFLRSFLLLDVHLSLVEGDSLFRGGSLPSIARAGSTGTFHLLVRRWHAMHAGARTVAFARTFCLWPPSLSVLVVLGRYGDVVEALQVGGAGRLKTAASVRAAAEPLVGPESVLCLDGLAHRVKRRKLHERFFDPRAVSRAVGACATLPQLFEALEGSGADLTPVLRQVALGTFLATHLEPPPSAELVKRLAAILPRLTRSIEVRINSPPSPWSASELADRDEALALLEATGLLSEDLGEAAFMAIAATETTASTLAFSLRRLGCSPRGGAGDEQGRARADPKYLRAFVEETLRFHAVAPITSRVVVGGPLVLRGGAIQVCEGAEVIMDLAAANRDPEAFGPDAHLFRPERWLGDDGQRPMPPPILTFSAGNKACPAGHSGLARAELTQLLHVVLQRFNISVDPSVSPKIDPNDEGEFWFTCSPAGGLPGLRLTRRSSPE